MRYCSWSRTAKPGVRRRASKGSRAPTRSPRPHHCASFRSILLLHRGRAAGGTVFWTLHSRRTAKRWCLGDRRQPERAAGLTTHSPTHASRAITWCCSSGPGSSRRAAASAQTELPPLRWWRRNRLGTFSEPPEPSCRRPPLVACGGRLDPAERGRHPLPPATHPARTVRHAPECAAAAPVVAHHAQASCQLPLGAVLQLVYEPHTPATGPSAPFEGNCCAYVVSQERPCLLSPRWPWQLPDPRRPVVVPGSDAEARPLCRPLPISASLHPPSPPPQTSPPHTCTPS